MGQFGMDWNTFLQNRQAGARPLLIAHRGAPLVAPENSLAGFAAGLAQGADVLETDLRVSADGEIVLFHDATPARTSDGQGPLFAQTLAQLKQWRLRGPDGRLTEERIPTLLELLTLTQGKVPLLLELKDWRFLQPTVAQRLVRLLAAYGLLAKCAIISFNQVLVAAVHAVAPTLPVGLVTMTNPRPSAVGQLLGPAWPLLWLNPRYVADAHQQGKIVAPLDTTPASRMGYYRRLGVDALLADDPAGVLAAMEQVYGVPVGPEGRK
jgi:glycerophosphoryl diester phosphodiesterase